MVTLSLEQLYETAAGSKQVLVFFSWHVAPLMDGRRQLLSLCLSLELTKS